MDDARELRSRIIERPGARYDESPAGSTSILLRTKTLATYPTAAARYYACDVVRPGGTESEGSSGVLTAEAGTVVYALNLGNAIPPSGTYIIGNNIDGRIIFRYD